MIGNKLNKTICALLLVIGIILIYPNNVFAKTKKASCTYESANSSIYSFSVNEDYTDARGSIRLYKGGSIKGADETICNWDSKGFGGVACQFEAPYSLKSKLKGKKIEEVCPNTIVITQDGFAFIKNTINLPYAIYTKITGKDMEHDVEVYGFTSESDANKFISGGIRYKYGLSISEGITLRKYDTLLLTSVTTSGGDEVKTDVTKENNEKLENTFDLSSIKDKVDLNSGDPTSNCQAVLGSSVVELLQMIFNYIKVLGPILVIIMSSLDFTKTILAGDEDSMKKAQKNLGIRLICAVGLYFLPIIITIIINLIFGTSGSQICGIK